MIDTSGVGISVEKDTGAGEVGLKLKKIILFCKNHSNLNDSARIELLDTISQRIDKLEKRLCETYFSEIAFNINLVLLVRPSSPAEATSDP